MKGETEFESCALEYTLPGYPDYKMSKNSEAMVTKQNVNEFVREVIDATIGKGVINQIAALKRGFSELISLDYFRSFSVAEIEGILCGERCEDWSVQAIQTSIVTDHGYSSSSRVVLDLVNLLSNFSTEERRQFMRFCTGSPKLPLGGFQALLPPLTIVRKVSKYPDECLPSVMTCAHYLKVPEYSSPNSMREKFLIAIYEGQSSFHLS